MLPKLVICTRISILPNVLASLTCFVLSFGVLFQQGSKTFFATTLNESVSFADQELRDILLLSVIGNQ